MASNFDSMWERASSTMHDAYDEILGDRVEYSTDSGSTFAVISATVIDNVDGETSLEALDEDFAVRKRVKVRKAIVELPALTHRIRHPKLGAGTFRPTNSVPQTEGNYWLFDVQKVS